MTGPLPFPAFDPIALEIGPLAIRWYALAYIAGLLGGWWYVNRLSRRPPPVASAQAIGDFVTWAIIGVIVGGRVGYVLFYKPAFFLNHPDQILAVWQGGMSFHGGLLGVIAATILFCRFRGISLLPFADRIACAAPIGLLLGRAANFINGELYGRASDVAWAVAFPAGGGIGRHPSQLYEAALEGLVLFILLFALFRWTRARLYPGLLTGVFLIGYGTARFFAEFFREPDAYLGFLFAGATMGQLLSLPLIAAGLLFIGYALRHPPVSETPLPEKPVAPPPPTPPASDRKPRRNRKRA
jgi:phosphatidylglycerol---prolipoprotein diacylglyceryl transferase